MSTSTRDCYADCRLQLLHPSTDPTNPRPVPQPISDAGGVAWHSANRIRILHTGDALMRRLALDICAARRSIAMQLYFVREGVMARGLFALLGSAARRGVDVRILLDWVGGRALPHRYLKELRDAGGQVHWLRPPWRDLHRIGARWHSRIVVLDDTVGYTGGFGVADAWLGNGRAPGHWHDINVRFSGPVVAQARAAFARAWAEARPSLPLPPPSPPSQVESPLEILGTTARACFVQTHPHGPSARPLLEQLIEHAQRRAWAWGGYFAPPPWVVRLLGDAVRRGVDVRVLVPGPRTDLRTLRWAGQSFYRKLLQAGVALFEYQPSLMHAKALTVDGRFASIGALNLNRRSMKTNEESTLLVDHAEVAAALEARFERDLKRAHRIDEDHLRRRPWWKHVRSELFRSLLPDA